jgi:hypothetical protein
VWMKNKYSLKTKHHRNEYTWNISRNHKIHCRCVCRTERFCVEGSGILYRRNLVMSQSEPGPSRILQIPLPLVLLTSSWAPHYICFTALDGHTLLCCSSVLTLADGESSWREFSHRGANIRWAQLAARASGLGSNGWLTDRPSTYL